MYQISSNILTFTELLVLLTESDALIGALQPGQQ